MQLDKARDDKTTRKRLITLDCDIPGEAAARAGAAPCSGEERNRAVEPDHQGGRGGGELGGGEPDKSRILARSICKQPCDRASGSRTF
jgi:hypothetical protein